jgi:hypothetical protein
MKGNIEYIEPKTAISFLLPKHYSGRKPQISKAFGWYVDNELVAVCTFGKPASASLCDGICGKEFSKNVYELNRLCRIDGFKEQLSAFVSACIRRLRINNWIIVSYADSGMNHSGYIYQACNFIYTGKTKERTDKFTEGNKHSRHYSNDEQGQYRKIRTAKHRYVIFCTNDKSLKKRWDLSMKYPVLPYPKDENKNYTLGEYQEVKLVLAETPPIK